MQIYKKKIDIYNIPEYALSITYSSASFYFNSKLLLTHKLIWRIFQGKPVVFLPNSVLQLIHMEDRSCLPILFLPLLNGSFHLGWGCFLSLLSFSERYTNEKD